MHNQLETAVLVAAEHGAPPRTFHVGPDAAIEFSTNPTNPFDGLTVTHWSHDG